MTDDLGARALGLARNLEEWIYTIVFKQIRPLEARVSALEEALNNGKDQ